MDNMVGLSGNAQALKTYRDTLQHSSNREGERAHKLTVLYSANKTQPMHSPFTKEEVLTKGTHIVDKFY